jgi:hypothetical protein
MNEERRFNCIMRLSNFLGLMKLRFYIVVPPTDVIIRDTVTTAADHQVAGLTD